MSVQLAHDIQKTLRSNGPVVALETAVLTRGLPHTPWSDAFGTCPPTIESGIPVNLAAARAMTTAVYSAGGVPAWIGVVAGSLRIGLTEQELEDLATDETAGKASLSTLASGMTQKSSAGTTVAATLHACELARAICGHNIAVFATGGIGGMHRDWSNRFDVSADLRSLATVRTCVVASGAKSILDLRATVESLETLGIPVIGFKSDRFPCFIEASTRDDPEINSASSPDDIAAICRMHWDQLGARTAVLATSPVPADFAIQRGTLEHVIEESDRLWAASRSTGETRTPALLDSLATRTTGNSIVANLALLCNNATLASRISVAFTS